MEQILRNENLIFYILAAEVLLLLLAQLRTNGLLKKTYKLRVQKREHVKQFKEEVKSGKSEIPVVKFEKQKSAKELSEKKEKQERVDQKELAVLQEMMSEFFG